MLQHTCVAEGTQCVCLWHSSEVPALQCWLELHSFLCHSRQPSSVLQTPALKSLHLNLPFYTLMILVLQTYVDLAFHQVTLTELLFGIGLYAYVEKC